MRTKGQGKRILSIDGGGVRGIVAIEVLTALEQRLRLRSGCDDLVLADVFDLAAGTSSGAMIASSISLGIPMTEARNFFLEHVTEIFRPRWTQILTHRYRADILAEKLQELYGAETTLGSDKLRTRLLLVLRNANTDSSWLLTNNPHAKFNDRALDDCNLDLLLWQLVRASTAAPSFFNPKLVRFGRKNPYEFVFVDGALTGFNNPAFKAFQIATLPAYRFEWPTGEEQMFLLSVGTGGALRADPKLKPGQMHLLYSAVVTPMALIYSSEIEQDMLCRAFGRCLVGEPIDLEVGDMIHEGSPQSQRLFSYARINTQLRPEPLAALGLSHINPAEVAPIDAVDSIEALSEIGAALAEFQLSDSVIEKLLPL